MEGDPHPGPRSRSVDTAFIDGVYNYCDGWCERCQFQVRCRVYQDLSIMRMARDAGLESDATDRLFDDGLEDEPEQRPLSASERLDLDTAIEAAHQRVPEAEMARILAACDRRHARQSAHPIARSAHEYASITHGVLDALRPLLDEAGDALLLAGLDTIDRFAPLIAVKSHRAVGALIFDDDDEDLADDQEFKASDGNGCAKLVRLVIAESREAWHLLMQVGAASADGVPAAMVRRLDALDAALETGFPRAMDFVRAGFDE